MGVLFLVWLACFALSVEDAFRQTAYEPLLLRETPGGYPVYIATKAVRGAAGPALAPGDAVRRIGGVDLKGATPSVWIAASARFHGPAPRIPIAFESDGAVREATLVAETYRRFWPRLLASLAFAGCAIFLSFWARPSVLTDAVVWTNLAAAIFFACAFAGDVFESRLALLAHVGSLALAAPLALRVVLLFPHGRPPGSALGRAGPWAFSLLAVLDVSRFYGTPLSPEWGALGSSLVGLVYVSIAVVVGARTYLASDALQRRQMRWVFLATYLVTVPFAVAVALSAFDPRFGSALAIGISAYGILPIALTIALVRLNLFDVDRLLGSAATYTVLLVVVLTGVLWAVPAIAQAVSSSTGIESTITQMVLAFGLALGLVRIHAWLRPGIDRVFFADQFAFERGMHELMGELSVCRDAESLARSAGERLSQAMRLESIVLFLEADDALVPVYAHGRAFPASFPRRSPLVAALEQGEAVLADDPPAPDPFGRAVLDTLGVRLVISIRSAGQVVGMIALGPKRSGDVYTSTETALLGAVADKIGSELERFDRDARLEASERLQGRLRRYVDPHLADRLDRDEQLDLGEREVAILFSDLRNYTEYAQDRALDELYATVSAYAASVSDVVHRHGGTVVDFAGDGVMAVFGAPAELPDKERAAVAAAREIVATVSRRQSLTPGVGIATGPAYVASLRGGSQLHWTALGDTTNLAARLQAQTRDENAWIVVDAATFERAGDQAEGFEPLGETAIRGRGRTAVLFALPIT